MKVLLAFSALVAFALAYDFPPENENFDMAALVADREALRKFNDCFLDKGPCTDVAANFKAETLDAVATTCSKCTRTQRKQFRTYLIGLHKQLPEEFREFVTKYDPKGKHFDRVWTTIHGKNF